MVRSHLEVLDLLGEMLNALDTMYYGYLPHTIWVLRWHFSLNQKRDRFRNKILGVVVESVWSER